MIATRFRAVRIVAGISAAALSCYLVSLQVAAERGHLMKMERSILAARADIRQLRTELDTRGRLVQLERWNAQVLGLQAPKVEQYAADAVQLASYAPNRPPAQVIQASLPAPAPAAPPVQIQTVAVKVPTTPAPRLAAPQPVERPAVQTATFKPSHVSVAPPSLIHRASFSVVPVAAPRPTKAKKPAELLPDALMSAIGRAAAAETRRK